MSKFATNLFDAFRRLQNEYGFVAAKEFAGSGFAPLVTSLCDDIFVYLFVHDGRPGNADVVISVWVAPPHPPDDGLDKLMVGFRVLIASKFDVDDEFFKHAQERVIKLLPSLKGLAEPVRSELMSPAFHTVRYHAYRLELEVYATLLQIDAQERKGPIGQVFDVAKAVASGAASMNKLEKACLVAAKQLLLEERLGQEVMNFYGKDPEFLASSIMGHLYVHALVGGRMDTRDH